MPVENVIKHEPYETGKLNALYQIIKIAFDSGEKQDYEILIDNFKIVPRTSNPELFNNFSEFINADSKVLMVIMFRGNSKQQDKYFFHLNGMPQKEKPLTGIPDLNAEEQEKKQKEKILKEIRFDELEKENEELMQELEEKESMIEELNEKLQLAKDGKLHTFGEIGSAIALGVIKNPHVKKMFPILDGLGGVPETNGQENEVQEAATFKTKGETEKKDETEQCVVALTEEEKGYLILIRDLEQALTDDQLKSVMHMLDLITGNPQAISSTLKHITNYLNGRPLKKNDNDKV